MQSFLNVSRQGWVYASLSVVDGKRRLKPIDVAFDYLSFSEPPRLKGTQVEIILRNGEEEQRQFAKILPHEPDATEIPIQLLRS